MEIEAKGDLIATLVSLLQSFCKHSLPFGPNFVSILDPHLGVPESSGSGPNHSSHIEFDLYASGAFVVHGGHDWVSSGSPFSLVLPDLQLMVLSSVRWMT